MIVNSLLNVTLRRAALVATAAFSAASASATYTWKNIQFGGFLSQGYLHTDTNNYPVDTTDGTFDFREYGLNASTTVGNHFRLGAQVFGQKLGKYGEDKPILDWAVADYNFRQEFGIRAGRVKYPRSLHSDVLDADVLRPYIFLPQSLYDARLRDFQASFDGAMIYGTINAGKSSFDYKAYYGDIPMKTDSGVADFFNNATLFASPGVRKLSLDSVAGATVAWNTPIQGLRIAGYFSQLKNMKATGPFIAVPAFESSVLLTKADYTAVSVEYTKDLWTFAGEYLTQHTKTIVTLPSFIAPPSRGSSRDKNYYVSVARRLNDKIEVGTYFARGENATPTATTAKHAIARNDVAISGRYDVNEHLLFKLEVHFITGNKDMFNVRGISNPPAGLKNSTTLFAAKTTVSF